MALVRWNQSGRPVPVGRYESIDDPECFDEDLGWGAPPRWAGRWRQQALPAFSPRVDVINGEKEILVKADLPGLDTDDLDLTITDELLTLKGERRDEDLEATDCYYCRESSFGTFERTIELPEAVLPDEAAATLKNGVLTLRIPKARPAKAIKIRVE